MRIACICSSYRRPTCLKTTLAQFRAFTIPEGVEAKLLILEDSGEWSGDIVGDDFRIYSRLRYESMGVKHNWLCAVANSRGFDAVMIMDDDDIYMSDHLAGHVKALQSSRLSIPARKAVDCHRRNPVGSLTQADLTEESKPNPWNHGSWAFMLSLWQDVDGYDETNRDDFDLDFGRRCMEVTGGVADYTHWLPPQYGYRWGSAPDRPNASGRGAGYYDLHRDDSPIGKRHELTAELDPCAVEWRRLMAERYGEKAETTNEDVDDFLRLSPWIELLKQSISTGRFALFAACINENGTASVHSHIDNFPDDMKVPTIKLIRDAMAAKK